MKLWPLPARRFVTTLIYFSVAALLIFGGEPGQAAPAERVALFGHRTSTAAAARIVGEVAPAQTIPLTLALALRDPQGLEDFLQRAYDPTDPLYEHFLTPAQFVQRFSPTPSQYAAVAAFARSQGLTITGTTANRLLLHVAAPSATVEAAFGVRLQQMVTASGRAFHAPDAEPTVPAEIAPLLVGVVGLDNSAVWHPQSISSPIVPDAASLAQPLEVGTGPNNGLSPSDVKSVYNLNTLPSSITGAGQTLALFELDSYVPSDISGYESYFAGQFGVSTLPTVTPISVDGGSGALGSGQAEVTLDIELQMAIAPGASSILVYEGPNSFDGVLDTYNQIAMDDKAAQISTSWGLAEDETGSSFIDSESPVFAEMAAQGQTVYAASGDRGAKDDGSALSVDDPSSQPFVTGTGGTSLAVSSGELYNFESAWGDGGGGISLVWQIPYWQLPVITNSAANASKTMRNVPDVSFDADPNTGYAIFLNGGWGLYGGTSCAAPIWAGFTALVNQQRAAAQIGPLGYANPRLYAIGSGQYGSYANDFHDVTNGSNGSNGYYNAVTGYDDVTGLGTFNGANLWADLAGEPTNAPALTATFTSTSVALSWTSVAGATSYSIYRGTISGNEGSAPYATTTGTTDTDPAVTAGKTYVYFVKATVPGSVGMPSNQVTVIPGAAPTIQTAAAASPSTVTGTTTNLSALGHDPQREALTYTWSSAGPAPVSFSTNGSSASNDTTATFTQAGVYTFTVTVSNTSGLSAASSVKVTVQSTPATFTVTPNSATVNVGGTQQFTAAGVDQFGNALSAAPTWTVSGGGTISASGLFTASTVGGPYTVTATSGSVSGTASVTVTTIGSSAVSVGDFGFESPVLSSGTFAYPTTAPWSFGGAPGSGSGIAANGSAFGNPAAPQGVQVAFVQGTGTFGQSLSGFQSGTQYTLSVSAAQRSFNGVNTQSVQITLDGTVIGTVTPTSTSYQTYTIGPFTATAGTHTLTFTGLNPSGGDNTAFLDNVQITALPAGTTLITPADNGFESPVLSSGTFAYPTTAPWSFGGAPGSGSGIAANGSAFGNPAAPQGVQVAFVQGTGTFGQSLSGFQSGTQYTLSVSAAQRSFNGVNTQSVQITLDGTVIGTVTPTSTSYQTYTIGPFTATAGTHTLTFTGLNPSGGDNTAFLDNVQITALPAGTTLITPADNGFESPVLSSGTFAYPTTAPWSFGGAPGSGSGIAANGSAFGNPAAPQGVQVAFVQGTGTFGQSLSGFQSGTQYTLSVSAAQRSFNGVNTQSVQITLDGTVIGTVTPTSTSYQTYTIGPFTATAGTHTLTFTGLNPSGGDNTAFLDNVQIISETS